jgi:Fic family protein
LSGYLSILDNKKLEEFKEEAIIDETMSTSAIEGDYLKRESVRDSIRKKLGLLEIYENTEYKTDNLVAIQFDVNSNYSQELEIEKIYSWHAAIFATGYSEGIKINVASFRDEGEMNIVSLRGTSSEKLYYTAPPSDILIDEVHEFLIWFNKTNDTLIKSAIAHLWFLIIHPFDDGNGRISRAIGDLILSRIENTQVSKIYSFSKSINKDKKNYYKALEATTGFKKKNDPLDITQWLIWFLETFIKSIDETLDKLAYIKIKTNFWDIHKDDNLNSRQQKVLNKILDIGVDNFEGGLTKSKYISVSKTSSATATRDIKELLDKKCIYQIENTVGRGTKYSILI